MLDMAGAQNLSRCLHRPCSRALRDSQHWIIMASLNTQQGQGQGQGEGQGALPQIGSLSAVRGACSQGYRQLQ